MKAQWGRFLPDNDIRSRKQLLKCHYKAAKGYLNCLWSPANIKEARSHASTFYPATANQPEVHEDSFSHSLVLWRVPCNPYGPDGWSSVPARLRRQQGGGGVMFWARIEVVGPFRVSEVCGESDWPLSSMVRRTVLSSASLAAVAIRPDLNPIETLWSILTLKIYSSRRLFWPPAKKFKQKLSKISQVQWLQELWGCC